MAPPKRALFSLNLDTDADHVYQKVEDHNKHGDERVKILETKGPTRGHTDLSFVTKPFENTVNRAVEEVIDGTGKRIVSKEGEITYSTSSSSRAKGRNSVRRHDNEDDEEEEEEESEERSNLNVVSKSKRRALENKYDTSEL